MFNIFLRLIGVISLFVVIVTGIGYLIPRGYDISAETEIAAPPSQVFPMVNVISNWEHWSTWNAETIPDLKIRYEGKESGVGSIQRWTDSRGEGVLEITKSETEKLVEYDIQFVGFPKMNSKMTFEPTEKGTRIHWSSNGELPSGAFYGYSGLLFKGQMEYEYQRSLEKLKNFVCLLYTSPSPRDS